MYSAADILIRIKNAQLVRKERLGFPFSRLGVNLARLLKERGFVKDFEVRKKRTKNTERQFVEVQLNTAPAQTIISEVRIISKPSRRFYIKSQQIKPVLSGFGLAVISTSQGLMTGEEARQKGLGGEFLAEIW